MSITRAPASERSILTHKGVDKSESITFRGKRVFPHVPKTDICISQKLMPVDREASRLKGKRIHSVNFDFGQDRFDRIAAKSLNNPFSGDRGPKKFKKGDSNIQDILGGTVKGVTPVVKWRSSIKIVQVNSDIK